MDAKIIKLSEKGQLTVPVAIQERMNLHKGDQMLLIVDGDNILLKKVVVDDFKDMLAYSSVSLAKLWDNEVDDVWNDL